MNTSLTVVYYKRKRMFGLSREELSVLKRLSTPQKIQDYLDALPINFELTGETLKSPRRTLREGNAHCMEGALLAATALWLTGQKPLLLDFKTTRDDDEHVITLFQENGYWGAISKTNHAVLRYRDPIYESVRELAASYFNEYYLNSTGKKTLRSYSSPLDLSLLGEGWVTAEENLWHIDRRLNSSTHHALVPKENLRRLRNASFGEREAAAIVDQKMPRVKRK